MDKWILVVLIIKYIQSMDVYLLMDSSGSVIYFGHRIDSDGYNIIM